MTMTIGMTAGLSLAGILPGAIAGLLIFPPIVSALGYNPPELNDICASVGAILEATTFGTCFLKYIKNLKKEKRAESLSLDNLLFNDDVIEYLNKN
jgi:hypothetical protein